MKRPDCGTNRGYHQHLAAHERACTRCCTAHTTASRVSYHRRRAELRRFEVRRAAAEAERRAWPWPFGPAPDDPLLYAAGLAGHEPAEALTTLDRRRLVAVLHAAGWTDGEIAEHTRMTTYTTARIRGDLGLTPNGQAMEGVA